MFVKLNDLKVYLLIFSSDDHEDQFSNRIYFCVSIKSINLRDALI